MRTESTSEQKYKSPYEAYPFLSDKSADLRCDFELLTDLISSETGLLAAKVKSPDLKSELIRVCELVYHLNASLRTKFTVTEDEIKWLHGRYEEMQQKYSVKYFVLCAGCEAACTAHILRVHAKCLVRLVYRHVESGGTVPNALIDLSNILSGYYFAVALRLNAENGEKEAEFVSRNYK